MPLYRCYFLNQTNRITGVIEAEVDALSAAVDQALEALRARPQDCAIEIWQGAQRLYPQPRKKCRIRTPAPPT